MKREELLQVAKPILFNTNMIMAIMDGRKTVTRRLVGEKTCIIRPDQEISKNLKGQFELYNITPRCGIPQNVLFKPPYQPGDILYVRETWKIMCARRFDACVDIEYKSGGKTNRLIFTNSRSDNANRDEYDSFVKKWWKDNGWRPSIHMPKEAARVFLNVMNVRV